MTNDRFVRVREDGGAATSIFYLEEQIKELQGVLNVKSFNELYDGSRIVRVRGKVSSRNLKFKIHNNGYSVIGGVLV